MSPGDLSPAILVAGYASLAAVAVGAGAVRSSLVPESPVLILIAAAVLSIFLSNDIVVLLLGPVLVARRAGALPLAALLVGANVSGSLLPQGSPRNLMLAGGSTPFLDYVALSWLPSTLLIAAGLASIALLQILLPHAHYDPRKAKGKNPLKRAHIYAIIPLVVAVALQPLADYAGVHRLVFGAVLLLVAVTCGPLVGVPAFAIVRAVPWVLIPVVAIAAAAAPFVPTPQPGAGILWVLTGFSLTLTDIAGAGAGAAWISSGAVSAGSALGGVSAAAFMSPAGSVSALLLARCARGYRAATLSRVFVYSALAGGSGLVLVLLFV